MEKLKSNLQNMVLVLVGVAVICGGILAYVNMQTADAIAKQDELALANGIKQVLNADEVKVGETIDTVMTFNNKELSFTIYNTDKGVAVKSTDPNGFGGNLGVLVGFNEKGEILGYTVLENNETPGLGAKAPEWFQKGQKGDIIGKVPGEKGLSVSKDGGEVDAITASTITSRAFLRAVNNAYSVYKQNCGGAQKTECTGHCADCENKGTADCPKAKKACTDGQTAATAQENNK